MILHFEYWAQKNFKLVTEQVIFELESSPQKAISSFKEDFWVVKVLANV